MLAESLDYEQTLKTVARLAVPEVADWCIIDLLRHDHALVRVATEHRDPRRRELALELHSNPPRHDADSGAPRVVRTRTTEFVSRFSDSLLQQRERDPERIRILRSLGLNSMICVPLVSRERLLGTITLWSENGRDLTRDDVRLAEDLARRAATAIDNARLYEDARRAVRARDEILAIVTHDLRSPLSAVIIGASLLASDADSRNTDRIRRRAETIRRAAQYMSRLVTDLTDLAQIDAGRLAIERQKEDPAEIVHDAVETLEPVVRKRGGHLRSELAPHLPKVFCDRERLVQVISNLVANASKAGAHSIAVCVTADNSDVRFSVADDGPGIPAEDIPHMFERYFRGRNVDYKGTGLGLPIATGIVKAHGGRMWIDSTPGVGSTFFFALPR